jgi:tetratricopeptide (TPR) repeat protein
VDENLLAALAGRYALHDCPEWRSLLRLLDYTEGFAFVPLIVPDAPGAEVCRRALADHFVAEGKSLPSLPLSPVGKDELPLQPLLDFPVPADAGALWVTPDPDAWAADATRDPADPLRFEDLLWPRFAVHANQARDIIRHRLKVPLILVGTPKLVEHLRRQAPDLWSVRDTVIRPEPRDRDALHLPQIIQSELPLEIPGLPSATGDLAETLAEIARVEKKSPASPALPLLLKRAASQKMETFRWEDAEEHLTRALEWEETHHAHFTDRILTHGLFLHLFRRTARHERGIFHGERALEIARSEFPPGSPEISLHLNNLAALLQSTNRLAEAEPLMRDALKLDRATYGDDHPVVAVRLNNLAQLLRATNRLAEAEPLMRDALRISHAAHGRDHPQVAIDLNNLGSLLQDTGRLSEAELLVREALRIDRAVYGNDHPQVAIVLSNLASLLQATNRLAEAEPLMLDALRIDRAAYGEDHPDVAVRLNNLAQLLQETNRMAEAEPLMRDALRIDLQAYGDDHPAVARDFNNLAQLLKDTQRLGEAEPIMRNAVRILRQSLGPDHPNTLTAARNLEILLAEIATSSASKGATSPQ